MFARNSGIPIKIIAAGMAHCTVRLLFAAEESDSQSARHDRQTHRHSADGAGQVLEAILVKNNIDPAKVEVTDVGVT